MRITELRLGTLSIPLKKPFKTALHSTDTVTTKNLEVVRIDAEQNLILVKGAVPGAKGGIVRVRMA